MDNDDERCCGTGTCTCIINDEGLCWCGQQWNGTAMCRPGSAEQATLASQTIDPDAEDGGP